MPAGNPRLSWTQMAPTPDDMHSASLDQYVFEISRAPEPGTGLSIANGTGPEGDIMPLLCADAEGLNQPGLKNTRLVQRGNKLCVSSGSPFS